MIMQSADFEICSTLERRQISADGDLSLSFLLQYLQKRAFSPRPVAVVSGSALRSATHSSHFRTNARNLRLAHRNSHVFLPHLNETPSLRFSWSLALRILMTRPHRPHLSYFLPHMVLNPSALSAPFTLTDSMSSSTRPTTTAFHHTALAKQATLLIRQPWAQHSPATDLSFEAPFCVSIKVDGCTFCALQRNIVQRRPIDLGYVTYVKTGCVTY